MYKQPDAENSLASIRAEIEADYETMVSKHSLPKIFSFHKAKEATAQGMPPEGSYPFKELQQQFFTYILENIHDESDINRAIEIFTAVWNYFPHNDMGKAPVEMLQEVEKAAEQDAVPSPYQNLT
tara:strand:+ start:3178 stop:3552 length:375 start_codon:yes stop_codon:yes gene_type:complete